MQLCGRWTGREVAAFRAALGATREAFAAYTGVSSEAVRKWERRRETIELTAPYAARMDRKFAEAESTVTERFWWLLRDSIPVSSEVGDRIGEQADPPPGTVVPHESTSPPDTLSGNIIDLDTRIEIRISPVGSACVTYSFEVLNLTDRPLTRLPRDLWFQHTESALEITPMPECSRRVVVQRVHDTPNLAKFSCKLSPPIEPGDAAFIGYTCRGGRFVDALYWRQSFPRHTRKFVISIHQEGVVQLTDYSAVKDYPNGSERSITETLVWDASDGGTTICLTHDDIEPNESITVRWEITA